jgi:hypothetical protein
LDAKWFDFLIQCQLHFHLQQLPATSHDLARILPALSNFEYEVNAGNCDKHFLIASLNGFKGTAIMANPPTVHASYNAGFVFLAYLVSFIGCVTSLELLHRRTSRRGAINW